MRLNSMKMSLSEYQQNTYYSHITGHILISISKRHIVDGSPDTVTNVVLRVK